MSMGGVGEKISDGTRNKVFEYLFSYFFSILKTYIYTNSLAFGR